MPKTPGFRKENTLSELVGGMRKPKIPAETGWHGVTELEIGPGFQNSWTNAEISGHAKASWYLSEDGETRLRGKITGGTAGTVAFTVPEELRPEYAETYITPIVNSSGTPTGEYATIRINPNGDLEVITF